MNKDSRILITGAIGLLGRALLDLLEKENYKNVFTISSSKSLDLTNARSTLRYISSLNPEYVFHLAGKVAGIGGNVKNQYDMFYVNNCINTNVIEACRVVGVKKIIAMGTGAIYAEGLISESNIWREKPHESEYGYAQAKRTMLAQLEVCKEQYGMDYAFIVSSNLYGPHDKFNEETGHVIPSLIARCHAAIRKGEKSIKAWGNGEAIRNFTYVEDMAEALIHFASVGDESINVGYPQSQNIAGIADHLSRISGVEIKFSKTGLNGSKSRMMNTGKMIDLGFMPKTKLEEGLKKTWDWYCENWPKVRT